METISPTKNVIAKKQHTCNWCGGDIAVGEKYQRGVFKYDGIYTWKNHFKCAELVDVLDMEGADGVNEEDFYEYVNEEYLELLRKEDTELSNIHAISFKERVDFVYQKRCGENK